MRFTMAVTALVAAVGLALAGAAPATSHRVLLVGKHAHYKRIQTAVNAAHPGDWILIAPGDYKGTVRIRKPNLHLRGMSRSRVIVDGTKAGRPCNSRAKNQVFRRDGEAGIQVFKKDGVSIDNLTVCNFVGDGVNEIWWNGGDGSGKIGMSSWYGSFLTTTTTYFNPRKRWASYGIFASNARGPGLLTDSYGSNMQDSAFYVGACHPCNATLDRLHGQYNLDGYSGTNSSGVLVQNSEFDHNTEGLTTNSQNNDDAPSPQLGSTFTGNYIHDNNNPNVPHSSGSIHAVGNGLVITGGRNNVVKNNRVANNGAWGVLVVPFIDDGVPPKVAHCQGGVASKGTKKGEVICYFDDFNNEVADNVFSGNGFFGNPTNGDMGDISGQNAMSNCWHGNVRADGSPAVSEPSDLQTTHAICGQPGHGDDIGSELANQVLCDTELLSKCKADATHRYPRPRKVRLHKLPKLPGMPNPCAGVPANPWCKGGQVVHAAVR